MKTIKIVVAIVLMVISINSNATVRTLNNNTPTPGGQYSTFSSAQLASSNGDTIYVIGSSTNYGSANISKELTLIGTGHNPDKQNPLISSFSSITISGSNLKIIGIKITSGFGTLNNAYTNVYISRCSSTSLSGGATASTGWIIEGNIFTNSGTNINFPGLTNSYLQNNIFNGTIPSSTGLYIFNNLFLFNGAVFTSSTISCLICNNIFYRALPTGQNNNCTTTFNCAWPISNLFSGDNDGNNIVADPSFMNFAVNGASFSYTHDYHLQAGSPCITNLGIDGSERGIYGGGGPLNPTIGNSTAYNAATSNGGEPAIPQIRLMNVTPTTVPAGQSINVNISSTRKQ